MAVRVFALGIVLGFVAPAVLALLPVSAADAAFPAVPMHYRQQFPATGTHASTRKAENAPRAPGHADGRRPFVAAKRDSGNDLFAATRSGARKAVPITRGQDLGLRFRPDERESADGYVVTPQGGITNNPFQSGEQTQFRPAPTRRKRTYEELQAETEAPQSLAPPPLPYPMMPAPPMPPYQQYFPHW